MLTMVTSRISEADAARDLPGLLARVSAGEEIIIESSFGPVAVMRAPAPRPRSAEEILARLPYDSPATIDEDFAADVGAVVAEHRESLNPPSWD